MEALNRLQSNITDLAGMHECVIVPGLGAFIRRNLPASANKFTGEIKPAGDTLFFNNAIQTDDGLLLHYRSTQVACTYSEAAEMVKNEVDALIAELKHHRNCRFGILGNFFLNQEGKIFFMPSAHLNISRNAFGLPLLNIKTQVQSLPLNQVASNTYVTSTPVAAAPQVQREQEITKEPELTKTEHLNYTLPAVEEAAIMEMEVEEVHQIRSNKGFVWKIAAVLAIVSLSASALIFTQRYWQPLFNKHTQNASVVNVPVAETPKPLVTQEAQKTPEQTTNTTETVATPRKEKTEQPQQQVVQEENEEAVAIPFNEGAFREKVEHKIIPSFKKELKKKNGSFYAVGGQYLEEKNAIDECVRWKKKGIDACYSKSEGSKLIKVLLNRFNEQRDAELYIEQLPQSVTSKLTVKSLNIKF